MNELQYTLLSDGATDKALMPILTWLLRQHLPNCAVQSNWADLRLLPKPPKVLRERIRTTVDLYPCSVLFVHRDAEGKSLMNRKDEIDCAVGDARDATEIPPAIAVIPVRMMEAWLLLDEQAIRVAAGNPNGSTDLNLPRAADVENIPDPKSVLRRIMLDATELGTHRRKRFDVSSAVQRIPQCIDDFSVLRSLSAFKTLEESVVQVIKEQRWQQ